MRRLNIAVLFCLALFLSACAPAPKLLPDEFDTGARWVETTFGMPASSIPPEALCEKIVWGVFKIAMGTLFVVMGVLFAAGRVARVVKVLEEDAIPAMIRRRRELIDPALTFGGAFLLMWLVRHFHFGEAFARDLFNSVAQYYRSHPLPIPDKGAAAALIVFAVPIYLALKWTFADDERLKRLFGFTDEDEEEEESEHEDGTGAAGAKAGG